MFQNNFTPRMFILVFFAILSVGQSQQHDFNGGDSVVNMEIYNDQWKTRIPEGDIYKPGHAHEIGRLLFGEEEILDPEDVINGNITCDICKWFVGEVQKMVKRTDPEKLIVDFAIEVCKVKKIEDDRVCTMIIHEYKDVFMYVLLHGKFIPEEACGQFLDNVCPSYDGPWWNVTFPNTTKPTPEPPKPPKPDAPKLKFLRLSDIHIDFQYKEGTITNCGEPICCRDFKKPLTSSTSKLKKAGKYGNSEYCDACPAMVSSLFQHLSTIKDQFDFILFTGDAPAHDVWNQTTQDQLAHVDYLDNLFATFLPGIPVYYCMGNHEGVPVNTFPPPGIKEFTMDWLYTPLTKYWGKWLDDSARKEIQKCGSFSFSPYPGFRIISLNTNYANGGNFFLMLNATDPCDSLQWLVGELQSAEDKGEKVHIITHIPNKGGLKPWSWNYYDIVNRYENTIVNIFNGHSHPNWYQVYFDMENVTRPLAWSWVGPCASGHTNLYPAYQVYTMDGNYTGSSWAVLDFENYYMNETKANEELKTDWEFMYSPKTAYNMTSLYAADWYDLVQRMSKDDELFQLFYKHHTSMYSTDRCDGKCKEKLLKSLTHSRKT